MAKVRVQDATKELSTGAAKLLEDFSRLRRNSQDVLVSLRRISGDFAREEDERRQREAQEQLRQQYADAAQYMSAYSSEQPEIPAQEPEKPAPAPAEEKPVQAEKPVAAEEKSAPEVKTAPEKPAEAQTAPRPQQPRPQQGQAPQGQRQYGRPVPGAQQPGQPGQRQYGRPVPGAQQPGQPGQRPYGRPVPGAQQPGQPGQRPYGRPVPGAQGQAPQGQRPYGRPAPGAGQQGQRPYSPAGQGQSRPAGGMGGGFRSRGPELTPVAEKERVSNYDPNKKQYVRQNDPERARRGMKTRESSNGGLDDEVVRGRRKKRGAEKAAAPRPEPVVIDHAVITTETITVRDMSEKIGKPANEIIKKLMMLGIIATINNELDFDTAELVATEFGVTLEKKLAETAEDVLTAASDMEDDEENLVTRPPVVTIMGHVDHGKTSLLDYIRKSHVTSGEAGGITQHIGAYTVNLDGQQITFLDTPGHEAFTAMRLRGAQATDIAILVVAADDGVMPQTVEAINHAKAAGVQIIVAINKMDKPTADPDRIRQQLTEYGLVAEEWGGDTIMAPVSAHTGEGVPQLLEMILLVAEMQDYKANPNRNARGIIIEARLDKGRGPIATVLVKNGTLNVGDTIVAGTAYGRVRAMMNDKGERVKTAGPSDPVEVIGFNDVPEAGDIIIAGDDERLSRQVAEERKDKLRAALIKAQQKTTLDDLFSQISAGEVKDLNVIIKADVQGSVEAVKQSLEKLSNEEVRVRSIHGGVGAINETDVMLASASNAIIIGFNVRPDSNARDIIDREKIDVRLYRVIYQAIEDVQKAMKGLLAPKFEENILGSAQVRQTYRVSGVGTIAGSYVINGKIVRNAMVRLLRDNVVVHEGKIASLKRFKDDAREVATGYECGINLEGYNDVKEGDVIECFQMNEVEQD